MPLKAPPPISSRTPPLLIVVSLVMPPEEIVSLPPFSTREFDSIQTVRTLRTKGPSGTGWTSREYFVNHRGVDGGTMLVAGYTEDVKFVANNAGFLLRSVLT